VDLSQDAMAANRLGGLAAYRHPRVLAMLFLGFSAGLPFPLVYATLTAWLTTQGVARSAVGMFAWVSMLYAVKFLWAPVVDRLALPLLTRLLGRRRSWMLLAQLGVVVSLTLLSLLSPADHLGLVALFAVAVAFFSATQDICIDAYRIEAVESERQGAMAASYQFGYRIAVLVGSAGALYLADFLDWQIAYQAMAVLMLIGLVTVMLIDEPDTVMPGAAQAGGSGTWFRLSRWFADAVGGPFREFFERNGMWAFVLLAFIGTYRISDLMLGSMANNRGGFPCADQSSVRMACCRG
jgi:PAT family beta-lactamase induction signal transducer AmpG